MSDSFIIALIVIGMCLLLITIVTGIVYILKRKERPALLMILNSVYICVSFVSIILSC